MVSANPIVIKARNSCSSNSEESRRERVNDCSVEGYIRKGEICDLKKKVHRYLSFLRNAFRLNVHTTRSDRIFLRFQYVTR
jgi:hypothetical protein